MNTEEDVYFQRTKSTLGNGKCWFSTKGKRSSPEIQHQLGLPTATQYYKEKVNSIESGLKKGLSTVTSFKEKFQDMGLKKEKLLF